MVKDKRYNTVKILIETHNVTMFAEIFEHIPKTTVADDLGIHFTRMTRMIANVKEIRTGEIFLLSGHFGIDPTIMFGLIVNQHNSKKPTIKTKK